MSKLRTLLTIIALTLLLFTSYSTAEDDRPKVPEPRREETFESGLIVFALLLTVLALLLYFGTLIYDLGRSAVLHKSFLCYSHF